jgi:hypothetical protein
VALEDGWAKMLVFKAQGPRRRVDPHLASQQNKQFLKQQKRYSKTLKNVSRLGNVLDIGGTMLLKKILKLDSLATALGYYGAVMLLGVPWRHFCIPRALLGSFGTLSGSFSCLCHYPSAHSSRR